jgi:hypothetical protein
MCVVDSLCVTLPVNLLSPQPCAWLTLTVSPFLSTSCHHSHVRGWLSQCHLSCQPLVTTAMCVVDSHSVTFPVNLVSPQSCAWLTLTVSPFLSTSCHHSHVRGWLSQCHLSCQPRVTTAMCAPHSSQSTDTLSKFFYDVTTSSSKSENLLPLMMITSLFIESLHSNFNSSRTWNENRNWGNSVHVGGLDLLLSRYKFVTCYRWTNNLLSLDILRECKRASETSCIILRNFCVVSGRCPLLLLWLNGATDTCDRNLINSTHCVTVTGFFLLL